MFSLNFGLTLAGSGVSVLSKARIEEEQIYEVHAVDGAALLGAELAGERPQHPGHVVEEGGLKSRSS